MGPSTEDPPMPSPPTKRKSTSEDHPHANAHPSADAMYSSAITRRLARLPIRSPGMPASIAPRIVPTRALETVTPSDAGESR